MATSGPSMFAGGHRYKVRATGEVVVEKVEYGEAVQWLYGNPVGRFALRTLVSRWAFNALFGWKKSTARSRAEIAPFIAKHGIDMSEAVREDPASYRHFNDFFSRKLKPEARPFPVAPERLGSPTDGKVLVYPTVGAGATLPIKGASLGLAALLGDRKLAERYEGGSALVVRLAPYDYHRFHFPDDGTPGPARPVKGVYLSVHPIALARFPDGFCRNKRAVTLVESKHFGTIGYVEVGAAIAGTIVQTYTPGRSVARGEEKGTFLFGGSTIVLLFEPGAVVFDDDLVAESAAGVEVAVVTGEGIGRRPAP